MKTILITLALASIASGAEAALPSFAKGECVETETLRDLAARGQIAAHVYFKPTFSDGATWESTVTINESPFKGSTTAFLAQLLDKLTDPPKLEKEIAARQTGQGWSYARARKALIDLREVIVISLRATGVRLRKQADLKVKGSGKAVSLLGNPIGDDGLTRRYCVI